MMRLSIIVCLLIIACLLFPYPSLADNDERYQAVPFGSGGIFIIDTKEGYTWIWSNRGDYSVDGESVSLEYQGNVRANMKLNKHKQDRARK